MTLPATLTPERWILQLFSARAAAQGGVLRRSVADVERMVGRDRFLHEIRRRGYRVIENAGQFVIFCNTEPVKVLHPGGTGGKFL